MIYKYVNNLPRRYYVVFLLFLSDMLKAYMNTSPVIVIAALTTDYKVTVGNETRIVPAEFSWTSTQKGIALGSHAIGPALSVLGGTIVHKIGGATFLSIGMLGVAVLTLADPFVINIHVYLFTAIRLIFGFFEGLTYIGNMDVMARWTPKNERVRALTVIILGYGFGTAITFPLAGFLIHHFGWPCVFYSYGLINLIWCFVWVIFSSNDPATNKFVSQEEKDYLSREINYSLADEVKIPYKKIFTTGSVYALMNEFFVGFVLLSFLKFLPLYIRDVHDANIQMVGLISSIPQFISLIMQPIWAYLADYVRNSGYRTGKLHQWFLFWGKFLAIFFYFLTSMVNDLILCMVCITFAQISLSLAHVSHSTLVIDFAGQYSGFIQSLVVVVLSVALFLNPIFIGLLIQNHSQSEWNTYFLAISLLLLYGLIVFLVFGSGDLQSWTEIPSVEVTKRNRDDDEGSGCSTNFHVSRL